MKGPVLLFLLLVTWYEIPQVHGMGLSKRIKNLQQKIDCLGEFQLSLASQVNTLKPDLEQLKEFITILTDMIVSSLPPPGPPCPNGERPVLCFNDPCDGAECVGAPPNAICTPDYCGGCNTIWTDADGNVINCAICTGPKVECFADPCTVPSNCSGFPGAVCKSNYCGGCNAQWTLNGQPVKCCKDNEVKVECASNPCNGAVCVNHPTATCIPDECGSCSQYWVDAFGVPVKC